MPPISLAGPAGSGKGVAARMLAGTFGLAIHHLADPIIATQNTRACQDTMDRLIGEGVTRGTVRRRAKQILGDASSRTIDIDALVNAWVARAEADAPAVVVPSLREGDGAVLGEDAERHRTEQDAVAARIRGLGLGQWRTDIRNMAWLACVGRQVHRLSGRRWQWMRWEAIPSVVVIPSYRSSLPHTVNRGRTTTQ